MSAGIEIEQLNDLLATTQKELGKGRWTDIATDLQEYPVMDRFLSMKETFASGTAIQFNVMTKYAETARHVGLYAADNVNVADAMQTAEVPWRHMTANMAFDRREISMNTGAAQIVSLFKTRRAQMMLSVADVLENVFWGKPDSSTDKVTPFGIDYWLVKNATTGFNGGNAINFSSGPAGLDASTYSNWRNFTGTYTNITAADLFALMRQAATKTVFKSPAKHPDYESRTKYSYYTNYAVLGEIERQLELRNDNLGNNIAAYDGRAMFRRNPIEWVPKLDADTTNPIYGVNWGTFLPVFLSGEYMRESNPDKAPNQHNVSVIYLDMTYNFICRNRRRNFVVYAA